MGIGRVFAMLLNTSRYSSFVWALASVRAVFGILSGPGALCLCKFCMTLFSSSIVKGMGILFFVEFLSCSILSIIVFVWCSYRRSPGLAWYRHRRMGTLWIGGAEGLIARNFTQITGAEGGGGSQSPCLVEPNHHV